MEFISYHLELRRLSRRELKKAYFQKEALTGPTKQKIQAELLRRGLFISA